MKQIVPILALSIFLFTVLGAIFNSTEAVFVLALTASLLAIVSLIPFIGILLQLAGSFFVLFPFAEILSFSETGVYIILIAYLLLGFVFCVISTYRILPDIRKIIWELH